MDCSWQTIPAKRRPSTPVITDPGGSKRGRSDNRFSILDNESNNEQPNTTTENSSNNEEETTLKPPPIILPNVSDIGKMLRSIREEIGDEFSYKVTIKNEVRLMIKNITDYRKLIKTLDSARLEYHSYQLKSEKSFRIVIKGLHYSTPIETIKNELEYAGHNVRYIKNALSKMDKRPLNMFFVDLEPSNNNKNVYSLRHIDNGIITVEPVKKFNEMVQCYRCQEFGHTQNYCRKSFRCVKCSLSHPTSSCTKEKDTPPKCVHCQEVHTANYKGCAVYQKLISRSRFATTNKVTTSSQINKNVSYAQAARGFSNHESNNNSYSNNNNHESNSNPFNNDSNDTNKHISMLVSRIEELSKKQNEFMLTMMTMMQNVINSLCNRN